MITVRYFAELREHAGVGTEQLPYPGNGSLDALLAALRARHGEATGAALTADHVRIAVNQELVVAGAPLVLRDGDEVAFLPPVTGG